MATIGNTGPAGLDPQLHLELVTLARKPDPASEKYQADTFGPPPKEGPFGASPPFTIRAENVAAGTAATIPSGRLRCAEAGWLLAHGAIYRAP